MLSDLVEYSYSHCQTRDTTGYFSCIPVNISVNIPQDLGDDPARASEFFRWLHKRPLDIFLHRHILGQMAALAPERLASLALICAKLSQSAKPGTFPAVQLAALLLECAALGTSRLKALEPFIAGLQELLEQAGARPLLPLPAAATLRKQESARAWPAHFRDNIHKHKPIGEIPHAALFSRDEIDSALDNSAGIAGIFQARGLATARTEPAVDPRETFARAVEILEKAGILAGPEMRHEASLSPIALLRQWYINIKVDNGRVPHVMRGTATAYGRGLSLARARAACVMEIVERVSAFANVERGGNWNCGRIAHTRLDLLEETASGLNASGKRFIVPPCVASDFLDSPIHWVAGEESGGERVYVPAQSVFLFCNLGERALFDNLGSTGLGAGNTIAEARLAALVEVIERDAHATTPFMEKYCFTLASHESRIQGLLDDYRARRIYPVFQDITPECGLPVYRCFVTGLDGEIAQATGAGLSGAGAAISALTETPWPYAWAVPAPYGKPSAMPAPNLPVRYLEDLPDFSLASADDCLELVEAALGWRRPVYVNISREDLQFPVARALVPGYESDTDFDMLSPPGRRLLARWQLLNNQ